MAISKFFINFITQLSFIGIFIFKIIIIAKNPNKGNNYTHSYSCNNICSQIRSPIQN